MTAVLNRRQCAVIYITRAVKIVRYMTTWQAKGRVSRYLGQISPFKNIVSLTIIIRIQWKKSRKDNIAQHTCPIES